MIYLILMGVNTKFMVFWDVTWCSLAESYTSVLEEPTVPVVRVFCILRMEAS